MPRLIAVVAALATSASLFTATAGHARPGAADYYRATPVSAPARNSVVTRNTLWKCGEGACIAARATSRDAVVCELAVQRLGALTAFHANGTAFDDEQLKRCNARAK